MTAALIYVGVHAALGVAGSLSSAVASAHFVFVAAMVVWVTCARRPLEQVAAVAMYAGASEVFWRMTGGAVAWEGAKFLVVVALGWSVVRMGFHQSTAKLAGIYFGLLLPGVVGSMLFFETLDAREQVSFNLAGPAVIAVSVAFFCSVRSSTITARAVQWAVIGPVVAVSAIALRTTLMHGSNILFTDESNFYTSGGYGPNQVANILSFGALVLVLMALRGRNLRLLVVELSLAVLFVAQSVLTFSRGGLGNLVAALSIGSLLAITQLMTVRTVLAAAAIAIVVVFGVAPRLELFTSGQLSARFLDSGVTGRQQILDGDLRLFREHPVFGVGLGVASEARTIDELRGDAAHTEFSRLLAEHGTLGAVALIVLLILITRAVMGAAAGADRFAASALCAWAIVEMGHSAVRLAVTGVAFGLAWMYANGRPERSIADGPTQEDRVV